MDNQFYIYLKSTNDDPSNIFCNLPEQIRLSGKWKCAVKEAHIDITTESTENPKLSAFLIYSDINETVFHNGQKEAILRRIPISSNTSGVIKKILTYSKPIYIPVKVQEFNSISLQIRHSFHVSPFILSGGVSLTLHFKSHK